jgi:hypothetical protein
MVGRQLQCALHAFGRCLHDAAVSAERKAAPHQSQFVPKDRSPGVATRAEGGANGLNVRRQHSGRFGLAGTTALGVALCLVQQPLQPLCARHAASWPGKRWTAKMHTESHKRAEAPRWPVQDGRGLAPISRVYPATFSCPAAMSSFMSATRPRSCAQPPSAQTLDFVLSAAVRGHGTMPT